MQNKLTSALFPVFLGFAGLSIASEAPLIPSVLVAEIEADRSTNQTSIDRPSRFRTETIGKGLDELSLLLISRQKAGTDNRPFPQLRKEVSDAFFQTPTIMRLLALEGALETNISEIEAAKRWQVIGSFDQGTRQGTTDGGLGTQSIQGTKILYDFGSIEAQKESTRGSINSQKNEIRQSRSESLLAMIEARLAIAAAEDTLQLSEQFLTTRVQFLELVKEKLEIGVSSETDVIRAEAKTFEAQAQLPLARQALQSAKNEYIELYGIEPPAAAHFALPDTALVSKLDWENVIQNHSRMLVAENELIASMKSVEVIERGGRGSFGLKAIGSVTDTPTTSSNENFDLLVTYSVELNDGGARQARLERAKAEVAEVNHQLEVVKRELLKQIQLAYGQYNSSTQQLSAYIDVLKATIKASDATKELFLYNRGSLTDIFRIQDEYFATAKDVVSTGLEAQLAYYRFLLESDRLIEAFEITF